MSDLTTVSERGRVTIPRAVRDRLGLKAGDKIAWTILSDGTIVLRPKTGRLADLFGILNRPDLPTVAVEDMDPFAPAAE